MFNFLFSIQFSHYWNHSKTLHCTTTNNNFEFSWEDFLSKLPQEIVSKRFEQQLGETHGETDQFSAPVK